jgi:hypothetical protein
MLHSQVGHRSLLLRLNDGYYGLLPKILGPHLREPFDPDRVLKDTLKPPAELTIPKADEVKVRPCPQDDVLQTPVTPVSAEALMSLQNFIIKKYAHALNETSKQSLARHL